MSFGIEEAANQEELETTAEEDQRQNANPVLTSKVNKTSSPTVDPPRQSRLTKQLIELSKKTNGELSLPVERPLPVPAHTSAPDQIVSLEGLTVDLDATVDLSQPRSKSGQFWKTEYDGFYKRSYQELKNVIQYSENYKTFAAIKDQEAMSMGSKLEKELAKVVSMEKTVSRLAKRLETTQIQDSEGKGDLGKLVQELAQQTARAVRYKQQADHYKAVLKKQSSGDVVPSNYQAESSDNEALEAHQIVAHDGECQDVNSIGLRAQLDLLREAAKSSGDAAAKLENENSALKHSLARVKEEMMSYESRRHAREDNLKRREAKQRAAREEAEAQLAKLTVEHHELLRLTSQHPRGKAEMASAEHDSNENGTGRLVDQEMLKSESEPFTTKTRLTTGRPKIRKHSKSLRKRHSDNDAIDIWTFSGPNDGAANASQGIEASVLFPSSVKQDIKRTLRDIEHDLHTTQPTTGGSKNPASLAAVPKDISILLPSETKQDIQRTLREISNNPIPDHIPRPTFETKSPLQKLQASTTPLYPDRRTHTREPINSPRPAMINLTSSPTKPQPFQESTGVQIDRASRSTMGRSASLVSGAGNRSLMSCRGSALPADRAAAAKARLAKRSAEKRRQRVEG